MVPSVVQFLDLPKCRLYVMLADEYDFGVEVRVIGAPLYCLYITVPTNSLPIYDHKRKRHPSVIESNTLLKYNDTGPCPLMCHYFIG